jgi:hypothetical protein
MGELLIQNHSHLQPWLWFKAHIEVFEDSNGVLQGSLYENVTKPYHQFETYVEPDVDHVIACTWHGISARCHGLVGICVESFQQIWLHDLP